MAVNFVDLIKNKEYSKFKEEFETSLNESADHIFDEFSENTIARLIEVHSQGHDDMVDDSTKNMEVFDQFGVPDPNTSVPSNIDYALKYNDSIPEDIDLANVIGILMDEGVLSESDLDTVTEEQILELSKKVLGSYVKKASDDIRTKDWSLAMGGTPAKNERKANNRTKGISRAVDRLTKESIVSDYQKTVPIDSTANAVMSGNVKGASGEEDETSKEFMDMLNSPEPGLTPKTVDDKANPGTFKLQRSDVTK